MVDSTQGDSSSTHHPPTVASVPEEEEEDFPSVFSGSQSNTGGSVPTNDGENPQSSDGDREDGYYIDNLSDFDTLSNLPVPNPPPVAHLAAPRTVEHFQINHVHRPRTARRASPRRLRFRPRRQPSPVYGSPPEGWEETMDPYYGSYYGPPTPWGQLDLYNAYNNPFSRMPSHSGYYAGQPYVNNVPPPSGAWTIPSMTPQAPPAAPPPPPPTQPPTPSATAQQRRETSRERERTQQHIQLEREIERLRVEKEMTEKIAQMKQDIWQEFEDMSKAKGTENRTDDSILRARLAEREREERYKEEKKFQHQTMLQEMERIKMTLEQEMREKIALEARMEAEARQRELQMRSEIEAQLRDKLLTEKLAEEERVMREELKRMKIEREVREEYEQSKKKLEEMERFKEEMREKAQLEIERKLAQEKRSYEIKVLEASLRSSSDASASQRQAAPTYAYPIPSRYSGTHWQHGDSIEDTSVFKYLTEGPSGPVYYYGIYPPSQDISRGTSSTAAERARPASSLADHNYENLANSSVKSGKRRRRRGRKRTGDSQSSLPQGKTALDVSSPATSMTTAKAVVELNAGATKATNQALGTDRSAKLNVRNTRAAGETSKGTTKSAHRAPYIQDGSEFDSDDLGCTTPSPYEDANEDAISDLSFHDAGNPFQPSLETFNRTQAPKPFSRTRQRPSESSYRSSDGSETLVASRRPYASSRSSRMTDSGYGSEGQWQRAGDDNTQKETEWREPSTMPPVPSPPTQNSSVPPVRSRDVKGFPPSLSSQTPDKETGRRQPRRGSPLVPEIEITQDHTTHTMHAEGDVRQRVPITISVGKRLHRKPNFAAKDVGSESFPAWQSINNSMG